MSRPRSPSPWRTSTTLLSGVKPGSGTRRWGLDSVEDDPMPIPELRHAFGLVAFVAELERPDAVGLDRCDAQPGLWVRALEGLQEGDAVDHKRAREVDRVDPAAFARTV